MPKFSYFLSIVLIAKKSGFFTQSRFFCYLVCRRLYVAWYATYNAPVNIRGIGACRAQKLVCPTQSDVIMPYIKHPVRARLAANCKIQAVRAIFQSPILKNNGNSIAVKINAHNVRNTIISIIVLPIFFLPTSFDVAKRFGLQPGRADVITSQSIVYAKVFLFFKYCSNS